MQPSALLRPGEWYDVIVASFQRVASTVVGYVPNLLGAIAILIAGWLIAKAVQSAAGRIMRWTKLDALFARTSLEQSLRNAGLDTTTTGVIEKLTYWIVFVVFLIAAADTLGLEVVNTALTRFVGYIPSVIAAVLILAFGAYIARIVRDGITAGMMQARLAYPQTVGRIAEAALMVFVVIIGLAQLGLDVDILVSNMSIIVAGLMLAVAISFGLGVRDIVGNVVAAYYVRQLVKTGDALQVAGRTGKVHQLRQTSVVLDTPDGYVLVPNREFLTTVTGPSRPGPASPPESISEQ
ncbi:MAG: mechanosensitive ion channel [Gemmatimonadota bacterium]|nr:MAG: mechanosensitive ion channel [Gemmatimonadota bacterium]